jgi:lipopolysaccharide export system protein LptC
VSGHQPGAIRTAARILMPAPRETHGLAAPAREPPGLPSGNPAAAALLLPPARHMPLPSRAREAPTGAALARRRLAVRWLKWLLPALALVLLSLIAFWSEIERGGEAGRVSFRRTLQPRAEALRVVDPSYRGIDELSRPYTVTARVGQQVGTADIIDLEAPRADILLSDGAWVYIQADRGRFDRPANHLDLSGNVRIYHDNGTMLVTETAAVELGAGSASGDDPVAAQGGFGTLTSAGFRLTERGAVIIFTGQAHAVLEGGR